MDDPRLVLHWIGATIPCVAAILIWRGRKVLDFPRTPVPEDRDWPRVSIIVPCRDEGDEIEAAVRSLLATDYPNHELIVVDDASTDGSSEKLARLAADHLELRIERIDEVPPGWLGKCHALHRGARIATGEWLLFTDADTKHAPDVLRRAIHHACVARLDFLSFLPPNAGMTRFCRAVFSYIYANSILTLGMWAWNSHRQTLWSAASGAFILVRRRLYDDFGGHESLRLSIVDDIGIAMRARAAGGRTELRFAHEALSIPYAPDLATLAGVTRKNAFAVLGFSWPVLLMVTTSVAWVGVICPLWWSDGHRLAAASSLLGTAVCYGLVRRYSGASVWSFLLQPLVCIVTTALVWRSAIVVTLERGVRWRGRHYELGDLKGRTRA